MATSKLEKPYGIYIGHGISSDGSYDSGTTYNGYTEADLMKPITLSCIKYLKKSGFKNIVTDAPDNKINMYAQVAKSNNKGAKIHVAFHCDYPPSPKGTYPLYISEEGKKLAEAMNKYVMKYSGLTTRGCSYKSDLYELTGTNMPAVIFECGSIKNDLKILRTKADEIGKGAAEGICEYLGVEFMPGATKAEKLLKAMKKVSEDVKKNNFKYDGKATYTTYLKALKDKKTLNCALAATWALQAIKVLPKNRRIWLGNSVNGNGAATLKKRAIVTHPNKRPKFCHLEPGDICGFQWGDSKDNKVHTMVYAGKNKRGKMLWWTFGSSDMKLKKHLRRRVRYENMKVKTLVRLKED